MNAMRLSLNLKKKPSSVDFCLLYCMQWVVLKIVGTFIHEDHIEVNLSVSVYRLFHEDFLSNPLDL